MKTSSLSGMRKIQSNFGKRISSNGYEAAVVSVQSRVSLSCFCCKVPCLLRQIWKFKSHCKRVLARQRSGVQYNYDLRSYALNFDDGFL
ncbi:hypothetical protein L484_015859 [Morus notabilis]|uniref:Uncharacterized protein n=1 Tax=Morus notabilis TaxID=981085 RepID=W9QZJ8_9ROSA|nr:hypothetical protein L484_015859 [Morus notabilis]